MGSRNLIRRKVGASVLVSLAKLVTGMLVLTCTAQAGPEIEWASDLPQAIALATQSGELIMVVDLPTAAKFGDPMSLANDAFLIGTVGSRRLSLILHRGCIPVQRRVGVPPLVRRRKTNFELVSSPSCPVTYFCAVDFKTGNIKTGDLKVVHFVVGYVAADRFENEARWALENHRRASQEAAIDDNEVSATQSTSELESKWLQMAHLDASSAADVSIIKTSANTLRNSEADFDATAAADTRNVLETIALFRQRRFAQQLSKSLKTSPSYDELRFASSGSSLNIGHLTLALLPNARLTDIQQPCYELLAEGHCYSSESSRIQTLDAYLTDCARKGRPVLCLVHQFPLRSSGNLASRARHQSFLDDPRVQRRLPGFEVVPILQAELAAVQQRRGKPPIEITAEGTVLFALFDKQGQFSSTICSEERVSVTVAQRLSQLQ